MTECKGELLSRKALLRSYIRTGQSSVICFKRAVRISRTTHKRSVSPRTICEIVDPSTRLHTLAQSCRISRPCVPVLCIAPAVLRLFRSADPSGNGETFKKHGISPPQDRLVLITILYTQHVHQNNPHSFFRLLAALLHNSANISKTGSMSYSRMHPSP